jgi:hypothetical protein
MEKIYLGSIESEEKLLDVIKRAPVTGVLDGDDTDEKNEIITKILIAMGYEFYKLGGRFKKDGKIFTKFLIHSKYSIGSWCDSTLYEQLTEESKDLCRFTNKRYLILTQVNSVCWSAFSSPSTTQSIYDAEKDIFIKGSSYIFVKYPLGLSISSGTEFIIDPTKIMHYDFLPTILADSMQGRPYSRYMFKQGKKEYELKQVLGFYDFIIKSYHNLYKHYKQDIIINF